MRAVSAAALVLMMHSTQACAQEPDIINRTARAGHEVAVGCALRWNRKCEPLIPKLILTVPPDHGSICARDFSTIAKRNVVNDDQTCIGKRVRGLQVIYYPRSDYAGNDSVDYVIQFSNKSINKHANIEVRRDSSAPTAKPGEESIAQGQRCDRGLRAAVVLTV
jgi:hypothetical protein